MLTTTEKRLRGLERRERAIIALHVEVASQIAGLKKFVRKVRRQKRLKAVPK